MTEKALGALETVESTNEGTLNKEETDLKITQLKKKYNHKNRVPSQNSCMLLYLR
jgi:hypothetical protein